MPKTPFSTANKPRVPAADWPGYQDAPPPPIATLALQLEVESLKKQRYVLAQRNGELIELLRQLASDVDDANRRRIEAVLR